MKKLLKIALRILKFIFATVICILLTYSVLFSIAGTVAIISAYNFVMKPIKEVKALRSVNPQEALHEALQRRACPMVSLIPSFTDSCLLTQSPKISEHL